MMLSGLEHVITSNRLKLAQFFVEVLLQVMVSLLSFGSIDRIVNSILEVLSVLNYS